MYSVDLSAAFDLIRPGIFVSKAKKKIDNGLVNLINEFLTERSACVEFNGSILCSFKMDVGSPQG